MSMLGRFAGRALMGGAGGGIMTGDWGGAAGGAAIAGFGGGALARYGGGFNIAGGMRSGIQALRRGSVGLERAAWGGFERRGASWLGNAMGRTALASNYARGSLGMARSFIGRNSAMTNRIGGYTLASLGVGAGAYIGSTVLNSNR
jgi:hypothetical protein